MRWNNKLFHQPQAIADIILKCYTQAIIVIVKKCVGVGGRAVSSLEFLFPHGHLRICSFI